MTQSLTAASIKASTTMSSHGARTSIDSSFTHSVFLRDRGFEASGERTVSMWHCIRDVFTFSYFAFHHEKVVRHGDRNGQLRTDLMNEFANVALQSALLLTLGISHYHTNAEVRSLFGMEGKQNSAMTHHYFMNMLLTGVLAALMLFCVFTSLMCMSVVGLLVEEEIPSFVRYAGGVLNLPSAILFYSLLVLAVVAVHSLPFYVNNQFCVVFIFVAILTLFAYVVTGTRLVHASYQSSADLVQVGHGAARETQIDPTCEQQNEGGQQRLGVTPDVQQHTPQLELNSRHGSCCDSTPIGEISDCMLSSQWLPVPPEIRLNACSCGEKLNVADARICVQCGMLVCSACADRHKIEACVLRPSRVLRRSAHGHTDTSMRTARGMDANLPGFETCCQGVAEDTRTIAWVHEELH